MAKLDAITLPPEAFAQVPALCRRFGVARLDVVGSAVTGRFDPARSVLDLLVTFEPGHERQGIAGYFAFKAAIEALFGRTVDLLEEKALGHPYLIRQIAPRTRPALPARMTDRRAALLWDALRAIKDIRDFVQGRRLEDYVQDRLLDAADRLD